MREPDKINHAKSMSSITALMRCKLIIRDVMHYSEEECTSSDNEESLNSLLKKVIIGATVMKEVHEEPAPALMDLIQKI